MVMEVKHDGNTALLGHPLQIRHRKAGGPVIILEGQPLLSIGAEALEISGEALHCALLVSVDSADVDVCFIPDRGLRVSHVVQDLHATMAGRWKPT